MSFQIITSFTEETKKTGYISVYKPIAGWKAIQYWWNPDLELDGFWEPWQTGDYAFATKEEAIVAAKIWAEANQIPFFDGGDWFK